MDENLKILALTLYGEARGEPIEGIIAVGCVIRNRVILNKKTYKEICLAPKQFSCWNESDPNYLKLLDLENASENSYGFAFKQCIFIAKGIISGELLNNISSARHYMTTNLYLNNKPSWADGMNITSIKGNHTFLV